MLTQYGYSDAHADEKPFLDVCRKFYTTNPKNFINCGKQIQHLWDLHALGLHPDIRTLLLSLGLTKPHISTRPVLYFNHPDLASEEFYWRTPAHQDWRSMQGSLDSVVVWVPLVNVPMSLGAIEIVPGSHKKGLQSDGNTGGFGTVSGYKDSDFISVDTQVGDILVFSSFLVHRSGTNIENRVRWSCHFRYNNLQDPAFIERGYPHAYHYGPVPELLTPDYDINSKLSDLLQEKTHQ